MDSATLRAYLRSTRDYIDRLLADVERHPEQSEVEAPFPLFPAVLVREDQELLAEVRALREELRQTRGGVHCVFAEKEEAVLRLLAAPGEGPKAVRELRDFVKDSKRLPVVDRYIYDCDKGKETDAVEHLAAAMRLKKSDGPKHIHIVYGERKTALRGFQGHSFVTVDRFCMSDLGDR